MAQTQTAQVQNSFIGGLKTEFTGLNFPENACTSASNCVFTLIGDVLRREGIDLEQNFSTFAVDRTNVAVSSYKWTNVGGDGATQVVVLQVGGTLYFYKSSAATAASPLSTQKLSATVSVSSFVASGGSFDSTQECQFADGNGYLFIFHPTCDPIYCIFNSSGNTVTANRITVQIRDFVGIPDNLAITYRPLTLSTEHQYNLYNQGWSNAPTWSVTSTTSQSANTGIKTWTTTPTGLTNIVIGDQTTFTTTTIFHQTVTVMSGNVTAYDGTHLSVNITSVNPDYSGQSFTNWNIFKTSAGLIGTWQTNVGNYPSNADVWWDYKNSSDVFDPLHTYGQVTLGGQAPQGSMVLNAFVQQRSNVSGVAGITDISTTVRPRTGTWFQGRVWYSGVDANFQAAGDAPYTTWTENIYFSQIVGTPSDFGLCYQINDPTSQDAFDLLPTDGGVITIPGSGAIYRLFPIINGMLVFAANGIWFITGGTQLGFIANDYSINKISNVQSMSGIPFVNILGYPMFWNEEGIYVVEPGKEQIPYGHGGLTVTNLCIGTIQTFYNNIPKISKQYVRGDYNPLEYVITWVYRSTVETDVTSRYQFDSTLSLNTTTKAFYPYSIANTTNSPYVHDVKYIYYPAAATAPNPGFKYLTSQFFGGTYNWTFSEERDLSFTDWTSSSTPLNFTSSFVAGYSLKGQAMFKWQPEYVHMYCRNTVASQYNIQGLFDFAASGASGKFSALQQISNASTPPLTGSFNNFGMVMRRHKIRGHGYAFQLAVSSVQGQPFDIMGWAIPIMVNVGV